MRYAGVALIVVAMGLAVHAQDAPKPPAGVAYRPTLLVQIGVANLDRSIHFYRDMLGFRVTERRDDLQFAHLATNVPGLEIGLNEVEAPKGSGSVLLNISVEDANARAPRARSERRGVPAADDRDSGEGGARRIRGPGRQPVALRGAAVEEVGGSTRHASANCPSAAAQPGRPIRQGEDRCATDSCWCSPPS